MAEAAIFANAYAPSKLKDLIGEWAKHLKSAKLPFSPEDVTKEENFGQKVALQNLLMEANAEQSARPATEFEQAKNVYFGLG